MKIGEIFTTSEFTQSFGGTAPLLTRDDCKIENKTKSDHSVVLHMKRDSDGGEALSHLKVRDEFKSIEDQLLTKAFALDSMKGLTLAELEDMEIPWSIENLGGRFNIK